jgi:lipid-binding SYLF domain-containing protein
VRSCVLEFKAGLFRYLKLEGLPMQKNGIACVLLGALIILSGCTVTSAGRQDPDTRRQNINAGADNALAELYRQVPGSQQMVSNSKGVLVFPAVISAGFVFGASHGEGAMRSGGKTTGFYRQTGGSWGLQAGAQSQAMFILFMTQEALDSFNNSNGWTAGANATVAMVSVGANAQATTNTVQQPVVGYVLSNGGLMAGLTIDGTRITRLDL